MPQPSSMRVRVTAEGLARALRALGKRYVTVRDVSRLLGVSTRTAGRLLAMMEKAGEARRYSSRAYYLVDSQGR